MVHKNVIFIIQKVRAIEEILPINDKTSYLQLYEHLCIFKKKGKILIRLFFYTYILIHNVEKTRVKI